MSSRLGWIVWAALAAGCATHRVEAVMSAVDPADPRPVAVALATDPPLPGERLDGWDGLMAPATALRESGGPGIDGEVLDLHRDRDFVLMTHEWKVHAGANRPDPNAMSDSNVLTFNSKSFPGTQPLLVERGERVRIRFGNLSAMDHHPIRLHGLAFRVTATDCGYAPESAQLPETTVLVAVGSTRVIEFVADEPGDWAIHCHMTHHVMTQMGHTPAVVGADTGTVDRRMSRVLPHYMTMGTDGMGSMTEMKTDFPSNSLPMRGTPGPFGSIDMGGMFTVLKVRENPAEDPEGWYVHPPGTVAGKADPGRMNADGIRAADDGAGALLRQ